MLISEAAHQRKNRVLSDSSRRLSSLSKTEYDDDSEPSEPPRSFLDEMMSPPSAAMQHVPKQAQKPMSPLDLKATQRIAFCNLLSYIASLLAGCFVCHAFNGPMVDRYCPAFLRAIFAMMEGFGLGHLVRAILKAWRSTPDHMRGTVVKVLSYGSVMINLYPMWSSIRNQGKTQTPSVPEEEAASESDTEHAAEESSGYGFLLGLDEQQLVMIATFVIRSCAACLVFGLLGYDALYNAHLVVKYAR